MRQLELVQEVIIKTIARQQLGTTMGPQKGSKIKSPKEDMKRGKKTNKQRIVKIGVKLIESC